MSTGESWDINRHTAQCTGPVSVVSQCKNWCLAEGQGNNDQHRPMGRKVQEEGLIIFSVRNLQLSVRKFQLPALPTILSSDTTGHSSQNTQSATRCGILDNTEQHF